MSHRAAPHITRDTARYRYGRSSDHRTGRAIVTACVISMTESAGTAASVDSAPTCLPAESEKVVRSTIGRAVRPSLRTVVRIVTRLDSALTAGVVTYVPQ